jgi:hypothetical protein
MPWAGWSGWPPAVPTVPRAVLRLRRKGCSVSRVHAPFSSLAALDEAEKRIVASPATFPLFANLLGDVNMLMVEQARNALSRCDAQVREALGCCGGRSDKALNDLAKALKKPLIDEPARHTAVIAASDARGYGLPAEAFDPTSDQWRRVWELWTRYFALGCWPAGGIAAYEGRRASHLLMPSAA